MIIDVLKYLFLGLLQGVAEVLPISSSAHLVIAQNILNIKDDSLTFEIFLHFASLIAILFFLRKKIVELFKGFCLYVFKKNKEYVLEFRYCLFLVVSTIPTVIFTLIFKDAVSSVSDKIWVVGMLLIINGFLLFILTRINGNKTKENLNYIDALVIGSFQCLGIFPGISRSGSCLCGAFSRKIEKETAAEYAFLLFIPAALGAVVLELNNFSNISINSSMIYLYAISFIVTMITTYFSFKLLLNVIRKGKLSWFGYYCVIVGVIVLIYGLVK